MKIHILSEIIASYLTGKKLNNPGNRSDYLSYVTLFTNFRFIDQLLLNMYSKNKKDTSREVLFNFSKPKFLAIH